MVKIFIGVLIVGLMMIGLYIYGIEDVNMDRMPVTGIHDKGNSEYKLHPFSIESMRKKEYPGSQIKIEDQLPDRANYGQYVVSYQSDGLKIFGLLTIPKGDMPEKGWPAIVFNHGYIQPEKYRTTERYVDYVGGFAKNGYIVFKIDYRGHEDSEGKPTGAYFHPGYTVDVLNAFTSLRNYPDVDSERVGMWGHSMGGYLTLRAMVINPDIKAGVIWAGVVDSYESIFEHWSNRRRPTWTPSQREQAANRPNRENFLAQYNDPQNNQEFWQSISPFYFIDDISGPVQLHHGTADATVPIIFSENLYSALEEVQKDVEFYKYPGADHNISAPSFNSAMQRSIEFFNKYL